MRPVLTHAEHRDKFGIRFDRKDEDGELIEPSRTNQSFSQEADINVIMARHQKDGMFEKQEDGRVIFGDFSDLDDFQTSVHKIAAANEAFMQLPAIVRFKMGDNPGGMIDYLNNPENHEEAVRLGLLNKTDPVPPVVEVTPPVEPPVAS